MAINDVYRIHVRWTNNFNASQLSENSFTFKQTAALILDTPGEDLVSAIENEMLTILQDLIHQDYTLAGYRVEQLPSHLTIHEDAGGSQGGALTGDMMPAYVAGVVTLRTATPGPRGRGRLFFGPVNEASNTSVGRVGNTYRERMEDAVEAAMGLVNDVINYAGWEYGVWSEEDQAFRPVTNFTGRFKWGKQSGRSK